MHRCSLAHRRQQPLLHAPSAAACEKAASRQQPLLQPARMGSCGAGAGRVRHIGHPHGKEAPAGAGGMLRIRQACMTCLLLAGPLFDLGRGSRRRRCRGTCSRRGPWQGRRCRRPRRGAAAAACLLLLLRRRLGGLLPICRSGTERRRLLGRGQLLAGAAQHGGLGRVPCVRGGALALPRLPLSRHVERQRGMHRLRLLQAGRAERQGGRGRIVHKTAACKAAATCSCSQAVEPGVPARGPPGLPSPQLALLLGAVRVPSPGPNRSTAACAHTATSPMRATAAHHVPLSTFTRQHP